MTRTEFPTMGALLGDCAVVVCCGPGGAGKTTVAAAIALEAARRGRRSVVVTVDPARRLADALGLAELSNEPSRVEGFEIRSGHGGGELWAAMLDSRSTFDSLVRRYAPGPEQAEAILANRFYRNIAGALSGTQEYMATEKLYDLHSQDRFDLIVVDTPPTANALEFVDAPRRLTRFLDNPVLRVLMAPARTSLRAASFATQTMVKAVSRVVGSDVVGDAVAFLQAFEGMESGFRQRADGVRRLLADPATAFVVICSPQPTPTAEARYLAEALAATHLQVGGLIVNRAHPSFGSGPGDAERAERIGPLRPFYENLVELNRVGAREASQVKPLADLVAPAPCVAIPMLPHDVHDIEGLEEIAGYLVAD